MSKRAKPEKEESKEKIDRGCIFDGLEKKSDKSEVNVPIGVGKQTAGSREEQLETIIQEKIANFESEASNT